jgi:hypothetical protein
MVRGPGFVEDADTMDMPWRLSFSAWPREGAARHRQQGCRDDGEARPAQR